MVTEKLRSITPLRIDLPRLPTRFTSPLLDNPEGVFDTFCSESGQRHDPKSPESKVAWGTSLGTTIHRLSPAAAAARFRGFRGQLSYGSISILSGLCEAQQPFRPSDK